MYCLTREQLNQLLIYVIGITCVVVTLPLADSISAFFHFSVHTFNGTNIYRDELQPLPQAVKCKPSQLQR